ncbi:TPA: hypothetical protein DCQ22_03915 [Candidatus Nomurabacteria bacterium]|nr:hypothetical protein [Candidatus Nomurabacteria bacterium]
MELVVLNTDLEPIHILDSFGSLIWTNRYSTYGDFEIFTPFETSLLAFLQADNYLTLSDTTMIIEDVEILSDPEEGNKLKVTGRSLESILDRRIVWGQVILNGNFQTEIERLLNENAIDPTDPYRKINRLIFEESVDPAITSLAVSGQYDGEYIYDVIQTLCTERNIGFKISLTETGDFSFKLYSGSDRSYEQTDNPFVIFSHKYDNLGSTNYKESKKDSKTTILVTGEGDPLTRLEVVVENSVEPKTDLDRREMYDDASDISQTTSEGTLLEEVYILELTQRGREKLSEKVIIQLFDGQIEATSMYAYDVDFFMGDIVQLENEYGLQGRAQVTELIRFQDLSGENTRPTFTQII